ncbi:histidine kinase [Fulvivirgaceae bacterium PWU5]|uniref:Histidine kinase n=1 Tax=Dawidia cretensis TaxID=2782350 RepID=A0AAP2DXC4_9BACT|nr:histidine kinase [Dawidia cretensis]MBT1709111.1 histidine kinase [Dawidia cretensis]
MNHLVARAYLVAPVIGCLLTISLFSCHSLDEKNVPVHDRVVSEHDYIQAFLAIDTLPTPKRLEQISLMLEEFDSTEYAGNPYYNYLQGYILQLENKPDSALIYYRNMKPDELSALFILKEYAILSSTTNEAVIADSELMATVLHMIANAEKTNNPFTYKLYDLLARFYYRNQNGEKAAAYTHLYYKNHPFKDQITVRQRYHALLFILAVRDIDTKAMRVHLDSCRKLALLINDSLTLMRTYEGESQLQVLTGHYTEAVRGYRKYFQYLKRKGLLDIVAFNNMAKIVLDNNEPDSAIHYFREAIRWAKENVPTADLLGVYGGLNETYWSMGDCQNAHIALDSVLQIYARNTEAIQATKIEQIHTRYETEKKDQAIASLQTTNALNEKIITQQRWIFVAAGLLLLIVLLFMYNIYRRRLLTEKNENLLLENKRMALEQKTRQMQLNPHFIYNAIANLQGLIGGGKKQEANAYLVSFSQLMRNVLELNRHEMIALEDEITSLKNYIELQQMRFANMFDYRIEVQDLDTEAIKIPPMLLQPFVENAIEHGFKNIGYKGQLQISFRMEAQQLHIGIGDNGVGIEEQVKRLSGKTSLSRIITQERLDILFNTTHRKAWFETQPNAAWGGKGTEVNISIPVPAA